jgi:hypothetical protein
MFSASQLVAHAVGDYLLQSDWMANEKTKRWVPALAHGAVYSLPFLLITRSPLALLVIAGTHAAIDRYRLARFVVYAKNWIAPPSYWHAWADCSGTGYHKDRPPWLAVWLLIVADNVMHVCVNAAAIGWLR